MPSAPRAAHCSSNWRATARLRTARSRRSTDRRFTQTSQGKSMSFQQGLSGLNASSKNLEVIGNNVANANTIGAKSSRAEFADMYANAINGAGTTNIGIGVNLAAVTQQFTQGNISTTDNPLDLAIKGGGFFEVSN